MINLKGAGCAPILPKSLRPDVIYCASGKNDSNNINQLYSKTNSKKLLVKIYNLMGMNQ